MEQHEANSLVKNLASMWPMWTPNVKQWEFNLAPLNHTLARKVCRQLMDDLDKPPSWARFWEAYKAALGKPVDGPQCEACSGTGWVTDLDHPNHWPGTLESRPPTPVESTAFPTAVWDMYHHQHPDAGYDDFVRLQNLMNELPACDCNVVKPCGCTTGTTTARQTAYRINNDRRRTHATP